MGTKSLLCTYSATFYGPSNLNEIGGFYCVGNNLHIGIKKSHSTRFQSFCNDNERIR